MDGFDKFLILQELDPSFSGSRECKLLSVKFKHIVNNLMLKQTGNILALILHVIIQDLAVAIEEEDTVKFTDAVKEFDSMTRLVRSFLFGNE